MQQLSGMQCVSSGLWVLPDELQLLSLSPAGLLQLMDTLDTDEGARLLLVLWRTWQIRNNITHGKEKLSIDSSIRFLCKYWVELCEIWQQGDHGDFRT
jgi:hypothetical protein